MFLVKRLNRDPISKCIYESCPVIFASCLGVKAYCIKIFFISAKSLLTFPEGTVNVISIVPMIVRNHFHFVFRLKVLFSMLITNPTGTTFIHKIFETNSSSHVKYRNTGKV